jgi:TolA-binding protein
MKITPRFISSAIACGVLGLALAPRANAAVSDEDFNALKEMVQKMNQQLQQMQQTHEQDQHKIQQLQQQLGETQTMATNAVEMAEAVAQAQLTPPRNALHNFTMVGDAEIQYAKAYGNGGTHGGFLLADFAPIFLFQANDRILFEAGFDITVNNNSSSGTFFHDPATGYTHDNGS